MLERLLAPTEEVDNRKQQVGSGSLMTIGHPSDISKASRESFKSLGNSLGRLYRSAQTFQGDAFMQCHYDANCFQIGTDLDHIRHAHSCIGHVEYRLIVRHRNQRNVAELCNESRNAPQARRGNDNGANIVQSEEIGWNGVQLRDGQQSRRSRQAFEYAKVVRYRENQQKRAG